KKTSPSANRRPSHCRRAGRPRAAVRGKYPEPSQLGGELPAAICSPEGMSQALLELDGSFGEGGGQILRTSLALSLVTGKAFHLRNVRARRPKPGLHPQHLMSVRAAATVGQAQTRGASLRS